MNKDTVIPKEITSCVQILENAGFEAFLVGGCARDLFLGRKPKDWDITTNAKPEQIQALFPKTVYENNFGTVAVVNEQTEDETLKIVEITPYRSEGSYSDGRHPDIITFGNDLKDDLRRRDFTINSIAINLSGEAIKDVIDPYEGIKDIKDKIIRTVGDPLERFSEDYLRMMRAIRLSAELDFKIDLGTLKSINNLSESIKHISIERVRDEFTKIIMSTNPKYGIESLQNSGLLKHIVPELEAGIGVEQNQAHAFDVWEHLLRSLQHSADKNWSLEIRLSALFHDISKPKTRGFSHETHQYTFYGHELIGSRETRKILERMRFSRVTIEKVVKLVRWHMFFSDTEQLTLSAVRRMINNVGRENIWDLVNLRICDRIGTGRPKENPYRLRKYKSMIEEALRDPISAKMLAVKGEDIISSTGIKAGPKIGFILHALLEDVLDDPKLNTKEFLIKKAIELAKLSDEELAKIGKEAKNKKESEEEKQLEQIRKKHHVKP
jgi:poly(A) polymerase/tRNA nucleotidyltransferase (CCA-adding enzyme)